MQDAVLYHLKTLRGSEIQHLHQVPKGDCFRLAILASRDLSSRYLQKALPARETSYMWEYYQITSYFPSVSVSYSLGATMISLKQSISKSGSFLMRHCWCSIDHAWSLTQFPSSCKYQVTIATHFTCHAPYFSSHFHSLEKTSYSISSLLGSSFLFPFLFTRPFFSRSHPLDTYPGTSIHF